MITEHVSEHTFPPRVFRKIPRIVIPCFDNRLPSAYLPYVDIGVASGRQMPFIRKSVIVALAVMLYGMLGSSAHAGFIDCDFNDVAISPAASGCGARTTEDDARLDVPLDLLIDRPVPPAAIVDIPVSSMPVGGMSSQPVNGPVASPPVLCQRELERDHSLDVYWGMLVEESLSFPSPLATRLFRPPRV